MQPSAAPRSVYVQGKKLVSRGPIVAKLQLQVLLKLIGMWL
jgi:hypothetical protein